MKVLVSGGAGYIGSITARLLAESGCDVTVLDNFEKGHRRAVRGLTVTEGDVRDGRFIRTLFDQGRFDAVVHFAAYIEVGESVKQPLRYMENNLCGSLNVINACVSSGVGAFVFSSTAAVYGTPETVPITEDAPAAPINPYGHSKRAVEVALEACRRVHGLSYASLRYFNAAGAHPDGTMGEDHRPESHLIPRLLKAALRGQEFTVYGADYPTRDGTCIRDYIHVVDLARAHILALDALAGGQARGEIFNLGNGEGFSVREIVAKARDVTGLDIAITDGPRRAGDAPALVASAERVKTVLGWKPRLADIGTVIETAWKWHSTHPEGYSD